MSLIPSSRPVIGEDLDALREQLGLSTMDACWLYGMSMNKWTSTVKQGSREPVSNVTLALLARELSAYPEECPLPKPLTAAEVFDLIKQRRENIDKKRMAIMFGCEASSGYRWLTVGSKISPVLSRLFMVFGNIYAAALATGDEANVDKMLSDWDKMVEREALERGVPNIFSVGRWTAAEDAKIHRPIIGEDLDELREQLGLSTMDACWLFGQSMTKWMTVAKKNSREPVTNSTLALLVRALREHPEASPAPRMSTAEEVFDDIKLTMDSIDKKRLAIMFGCEASSGYRWITVGSKISPALARLFTVFLVRLHESRRQSDEEAMKMLKDWEHMVQIEAHARGVHNVFSGGRWTTQSNEQHEAVAA